jgi:hypothetical protein
MTKNNEQILSRDLGNQIPTPEQFGEDQEIVGDDIAGEGPDGDDSEYGDDYGDYNSGVGTPITMTGQSYYTDQAIVAQLVGTNTGR